MNGGRIRKPIGIANARMKLEVRTSTFENEYVSGPRIIKAI